jgi:signal transduction histidine kinase
MGESSPVGPERPRTAHRSIRFTFAVMVVVPEVFLVLLWGVAASLTFSKVLGRHGFSLHNHRELVEFGALLGAGLVVVLAAVLLMALFARRLSRDVGVLTSAAGRVDEAPEVPAAAQLRAAAQLTTGGRLKTAEIAAAAAAVATLQVAAAESAASERSLRDGLRQVIVSMARRNQSLLQRQLRLIDALEQKASDPAALADLFSLDHITTRMRRHAESLTILSGSAPARSWREPIPIIDVIRGAMAEVEDYQRVSVLTRAEDAVSGSAAADMIHLLAELLENAAMFSPSSTPVEVRASRVANGFAIEVDDRGLGIEPEQLTEINEQLAAPPDFDLASTDRLGLFVGAKLAARYGVKVALRPSPYGGTTAIVLLPSAIIVPPSETSHDFAPEGRPAAARPSSLDLDLGGTGPLALVGGPGTPAPAPSLSRPAPSRPAPAAPAAPAPNGLPVRRVPGATRPAPRTAGSPQPARHAAAASVAPENSATVPESSATAPASPARAPAPADAATAPADSATAPAGPATAPADSATAPAGPATAPADSATAPAGPAAPSDTRPARGPRPGGETYRGLPRRTRLANLSPHLRDAPAAAADPADVPGANLLAAPLEMRAPEEARDFAASLQGGWRRGRAAETPDTADPEAQPAEAGRPATTHTEEG